MTDMTEPATIERNREGHISWLCECGEFVRVPVKDNGFPAVLVASCAGCNRASWIEPVDPALLEFEALRPRE